MASPRGKVIPLSVGRKLVSDLLHYAKEVPSLPLARDCRIAALVAARGEVEPAPSWAAIFMKAYGLVAQRYPELRRAFIPYPWARLYEHPRSDCAILVERLVDGEPTILASKILDPAVTPLTAIDAHLRGFQERELLAVSSFRQVLRLGRLPRPVRRFFCWTSLYFSGYKRAKRFGTFMMSSLGNYGVEQMHPLTPLTTYFTFGPIQPDGAVTLKIIYDHRVMDGRTVARALSDLETTLNTELVADLRQMRRDQPPWTGSRGRESFFAAHNGGSPHS